MAKVTLVTCANDKYFSLLEGLITSVFDKAHTLREHELRLSIMDIGLTEDQVHNMVQRGCHVFKPEWSLDVSEHKDTLLLQEKGFMERAFLPRYVPEGTEVIIWLDADTWVAGDNALQVLATAASEGYAVGIPEYDRHLYYTRRAAQTVAWQKKHYEQFFSEEVARTYSAVPMYNSGVLAAKIDHRMWREWQAACQFAIMKAYPSFGFDQITWNYAMYSGKFNVAHLPITYNWTCHTMIPFLQGKTLVEPFYPHAPIEILHLTGNSKTMRFQVQHLDDIGRRTVFNSYYMDYFSIGPRAFNKEAA